MSGRAGAERVALLALVAHTGSLVPAASARVDLLDRIFTRIGASDDLARGQSTFVVEMSETANILNDDAADGFVCERCHADGLTSARKKAGRCTNTARRVTVKWLD